MLKTNENVFVCQWPDCTTGASTRAGVGTYRMLHLCARHRRSFARLPVNEAVALVRASVAVAVRPIGDGGAYRVLRNDWPSPGELLPEEIE